MREPRQLGEPSAGAKGSKDSGQLEANTLRQSRKVKGAGQPATTPGGAAGEQCGGATQSISTEAPKDAIRGNSKNRRRHSRKMQEPGQPGDGINRHNRNAELQRKLQARAPGVLKDARFGATRRSIAGKAGRCRSRGNPGDASGGVTRGRGAGQPKLQPRKRQRIRDEETRTRSPAEPEDAGCGATRNLIGRRDWKCRAARLERQTCRRMRESGQLETPSRAQPKRRRFRGNPET